MLDTIMTALRSGDFAAAAAAARELLGTEPDNAQGHHLLGLALRQLGEFDAAAAALDRAIALAPERAGFHVSRAMLAAQHNDIETARAALDEAVRQDPNQLAAYLTLAEMALAASDFEQAEQQLRLADRVAPEHPHLRVMRAQLLLAKGDTDAAAKLLMRAAEQVPDDALVRGTLGQAFLMQGHHAFAEQALRSALETMPQARSLRHNLIEALLAQGRNDEAEQELDTLLAQRSSDIRALGLKGQLAAARGAHELAVVPLQDALRRLPAQPQLLDTLLGSWSALGQIDSAISFLEALLAGAPRLDFAWSALLHIVSDNAALANDTLTRWRQACPDSANATEIAAQVAENVGNFDDAIANANATIAIDANRIGAQLVLARAELRSDQAAAAVKRLAPLYAESDEPEVRIALSGWLGRGCDADGDFDEAVRYWRGGQALAGPGVVAAALVSPDPALATAESAQADATSAGLAPVLLAGAPGSGVERIAAWLSGSDERRILSDRFGSAPRDDVFQRLVFEVPDDDDWQAPTRDWREQVEATGVDPARCIDWLPNWDARWLPLLQRGLPAARVLLVLRDPRDMLLNWLAFGAPHRILASDPARAAVWLARALEQVAVSAERNNPATLVINSDALQTDMDRSRAQLVEFLGLQAAPAETALARVREGSSGLSTAFAAGHWRKYQGGVLGEAFAALETVATRLGF